MVSTCHPNTGELEERRLEVQSQPELYGPCLNKWEKVGGDWKPLNTRKYASFLLLLRIINAGKSIIHREKLTYLSTLKMPILYSTIK